MGAGRSFGGVAATEVGCSWSGSMKGRIYCGAPPTQHEWGAAHAASDGVRVIRSWRS